MRQAVLVLVLLLAGCATPRATDERPIAFDALRIETDLGAFTAILFCDETPATCGFVRGLVERGYYDGRAFGRVIPGFVIQEVDRTGGTTDQGERVVGEFGTAVMFSAGSFGIARDADPDSGSSEFFVMDFATSRLYGNYTAFAQVVEGIDVVHALARVPAVRTGPAPFVVGAPPGSPVAFGVHDRVPVDPPVMTSVELVTVELSAAEAARYPLVVDQTFATDTLRATIEWPRDLAEGRESALAWYVFPRDPGLCPALPQEPCAADPTAGAVLTASSQRDPEPIDLSGAVVRYFGAARGEIAFEEDGAARGKLAMRWTPPAAGAYVFSLEKDGASLASGNVTVARAP